MADVFISYSKAAVATTRDLAADLEAKGLSVWWDIELVAGDQFRRRIQEEIKAARAIIVIWTPESILSDYVQSEAERARVAGKLIQVRTPDIEPADLPPPFDTAHVPLIEDRGEIYGALAQLGVLKNYKPSVLGKSALFSSMAAKAPWRLSTRKIAAAVVGLGVLMASLFAYLMTFDAPGPSEAEMKTRGQAVAQAFLKQLNAGLPDSSLLAQELRLGRRGLMSNVEAASELRKLGAKYSAVDCKVDGGNVSVKPAQHVKNGLRVNFSSICDFTGASGARTTERFPLEIEAAKENGADRITGMWAPEKMVLWQARN